MKHIIWDLDGTLIDSYEIIVNNIYLTFKRFIELDKRKIHREIIATSVSEFFKKTSYENNIDINDAYNIYSEVTKMSKPEDYKTVKHVKEILKKLSDKGYKHYIYTHRGKSTNDILKANAIDHYFIEVVTSDNGFKRKPDPEALEYLTNKYSLKLDDTYYVGDRVLDIECGINASIKTVYYNEDGINIKDAYISVKNLLELDL